MKRLIIALFLLLFIAPAALAGTGSDALYAVVHNPNPADRLNLRTQPSTSSLSLGKFYNGTPVTIREIKGEWAYAVLHDGFEGYMNTSFLAMGSGVQVDSAMPRVTVTAPGGKHVYDSMLPGESSIAFFPMGAQFDVMGVMEDWLFIRSGEVVGFTENSDTVPRIYFSAPEPTPPAALSIRPTPTPSPTPLPVAADGQFYARIAARTWLYEDEALNNSIAVLQPGETLRIESASGFVCRTTVDGTSGYVDASYLTFSSEFGPGYTSVPVEGARKVTEDDFVIFAAMKETTTLFADCALSKPIGVLQQGQFIRVFNGANHAATVVDEGRIAGYIPSLSYSVHVTYWPFYVNHPSAMVNNPVSSDRLHLRQQPSQNARSLGRYYNGTVVTLLDNFSGKNTWTHVDICGVQGYMKSEYFDFSPDPDEHHPCLSLFEVHNPYAGTLHLRTQPDTIADSLGLFENGTLAAVIGISGQWAHVICDGQTGFMMHQFLRTAMGTTLDPY